MSKIIITTTDTRTTAEMLQTTLQGYFGRSNIVVGLEPFFTPDGNPASEVRQAVINAKAMIILIGHNWLASGWANDLTHPLRLAITTAISEKKPVLVVCVDEAPMPSANQLPLALAPIAERIPIPLRATRFRGDSQNIVHLLETFFTADEILPSPFSAQISPRQNVRLAEGWQRFFAYLIDAFIIRAILFALENTAEARIRTTWSVNDANTIALTYAIIALVIYTSYQIISGVFGGQTIGKIIIGIRVVRADGNPLTWGNSFMRCFGYVLNGFTFGIGFAWLLIDEKRQGWHDKMAQTLVIKTSKN